MPRPARKILTQSSAPVLGSVVLAGLGVIEASGEAPRRDTGVTTAGEIVGDGDGETNVGFPALYKLHAFSFCLTRTAHEAFWF